MEHENLDLGLSMNMGKTAGRATGFLKYMLSEYVRGAALSLDDLAEQPFTGMPSNHSATNSQEKKLDRARKKVEQNELKAATAHQTILSCQKSPTYPYQQILLSKFVKKPPDWKIQPIAGYSNSQYYLKRRNALCESADLLNSKKVKNRCSDIPDLVVEIESKLKKSKSDGFRTVSGHLSG